MSICQGVIYENHFPVGICGKPAKHTVNEKHYCGIHNPNKPLTARQIAAKERYVLAREKIAKRTETMKEILAIYEGYKEPDSHIDSGNLYWALDKAINIIKEINDEKTRPLSRL